MSDKAQHVSVNASTRGSIAASLFLIFCALFVLPAGGCMSPSFPPGQTIRPVVAGNKVVLNTLPGALGRAGRIIARANGGSDFNPYPYCRGINPCPGQLRAIVDQNRQRPIEQQLHFVQLPIRALGDGTWIVAHDRVQQIVVSSADASRATKIGGGVWVLRELPAQRNAVSFRRNGNTEYGIADANSTARFASDGAPSVTSLIALPAGKRIVEIDLDAINTARLAALQRAYGDQLDLYRLKDFAANGLAPNFNYMLSVQTDPNARLISDIDDSNLSERAVLESRNGRDADWFIAHPGRRTRVPFTRSVGEPAELDRLLTMAPRYGDRLWGIEVTNTEGAAQMVKTINATRYVSIADSVRYESQQGKSATGSACEKTLMDIGSETTITSGPIECLNKMEVVIPW